MKMPVIALMVAALFAASAFQPKEAKAVVPIDLISLGLTSFLMVAASFADNKANGDSPGIILDQLRNDASMFLANGTETPLLEEAFVQIDEQADKAGIAVDDVQKAKAIIDVK
jgi:hypothetical protein